MIAASLVGGQRLPQVLQQILTILANPAGQRVPMLLCLDGPHQEAEHLARLFNVTVAIYDDAHVKKGIMNKNNYMTLLIAIILLLLKKDRQCKAVRERFTLYQSEDPQYQRERRVEDKKRARAYANKKALALL